MIILERYIFTEIIAFYMKSNRNLKMWGAIGVVLIVLLASGAYFLMQEQDKESVSILARVNDEGSGIFVRSDIEDLNIDSPEGWNKLVFMTPGPSSIQHMILSDIVKVNLGMKFDQWREESSDDNVVYWTQVPPGQMIDKMEKDNKIDGGIAWEPHYSAALEHTVSGSKMCKSVATTDEYSPNHPCCVVAVNNSYLESNEDVVKRFLAGYVKSVQWINDALEQGVDSEDYETLIKETARIGFPNSKTDEEKLRSQNIAKKALSNIKYAYYPNNPGDGDEFKLTEQLNEVIETYKRIGQVQEETLTNAGFDTVSEFTEHLIQDSYLMGVFNEDGTLKTPEEMGYTEGMSTIKVAYLAADVHQMALHIGISKEFYKDYGIHINLKGPFQAGGGVMNALLSKHADRADIGFVGSPPVVLLSINAL